MDSISESNIHQEAQAHGSRWAGLHNGYFSDPLVSAGYVDAVCRALRGSGADVLVDLGGGTGFILSELVRQGVCEGVELVNVDLSPAQLAAGRQEGIRRVCRSAEEITREDMCPRQATGFFIMRSVAHYVGRDGLAPLFRHLRAQTEPGEMLVHQTGCCRDQAAADCLNHLYSLMDTGKWYPTEAHLVDVLADTGWRVQQVDAAPSLPLSAGELAFRYGLDPVRCGEVRARVAARHGEIPGIFQLNEGAFLAHLPYRIFTCTAV